MKLKLKRPMLRSCFATTKNVLFTITDGERVKTTQISPFSGTQSSHRL
jgi:hypothetical protein